MQNPTTWANQNLGKTTLNPQDPEGITGQCVNAASSWSLYNGLAPLRGATAWYIWNAAPPADWQKIPGATPQAGDCVFYEPNVSAIGTGPDGHVDVCTTGGTNFISADADWITEPLQYVKHTMTGVAGVFRINQGEPTVSTVDLNTARRIAFWVYGFNGIYSPTNALNGDADTQLQAWIGQDTNTILQETTDDQYGQAYKAWLEVNHYPESSNATTLAAGTYIVK